MVAMKALNAAQASLMLQEIMKLFRPRFHRSFLALANKNGKKERCPKTESTDSDSYCAKTESTDSDSYSTF